MWKNILKQHFEIFAMSENLMHMFYMIFRAAMNSFYVHNHIMCCVLWFKHWNTHFKKNKCLLYLYQSKNKKDQNYFSLESLISPKCCLSSFLLTNLRIAAKFFKSHLTRSNNVIFMPKVLETNLCVWRLSQRNRQQSINA